MCPKKVHKPFTLYRKETRAGAVWYARFWEEYVNEQWRRNLTFHGLRHTFVTLGRLAGISDLEIQALARHKSGAMMERYSHAAQVLDFAAAREKLEKAIGGNA
jgi:integrase